MLEKGMAPSLRSLEWWCRLTLRALAASFAIVGTLFLCCPDATIEVMNDVGATLGHFTPAPPSALRFWLSLATGYMVLVTALAHLAQRDLQRHRVLLALLALGKATSSLTCLIFFLFSQRAFIYLANFLVDGSIALAAVAIWAVVPSLGSVLRTASELGDRAAQRALDSLLDAMVPPGGPFAAGAHEASIAPAIESFVTGAGPAALRAFRLGLRVFDVSPYFLPPFRLRRFSRLPLDDRVVLLTAWEESRLVPRRQAMHLLKLLVMSHFYARPEIEAQIGYPHPLDRVPRPQVVS